MPVHSRAMVVQNASVSGSATAAGDAGAVVETVRSARVAVRFWTEMGDLESCM